MHFWVGFEAAAADTEEAESMLASVPEACGAPKARPARPRRVTTVNLIAGRFLDSESCIEGNIAGVWG